MFCSEIDSVFNSMPKCPVAELFPFGWFMDVDEQVVISLFLVFGKTRAIPEYLPAQNSTREQITIRCSLCRTLWILQGT